MAYLSIKPTCPRCGHYHSTTVSVGPSGSNQSCHKCLKHFTMKQQNGSVVVKPM